MIVKDLIRALQQMPENTVLCACFDGVPYVEITRASLDADSDGAVALLHADPESEAQLALNGPASDPKVLVEVSGGVASVRSDEGLNVRVVDYDTEGAPPIDTHDDESLKEWRRLPVSHV